MSLSETAGAGKRLRVLVVDDDQEIGYMFQRLLGGPQVVTLARDGYEAIERARAGAYDLIFLDVRLPGIDGIATLGAIKSVRPDAIVIMMSGYSVEREIESAMALGAQDFLAKPFDDIDQIMTIAEAARYLSLHELTVRRLAREGKTSAFAADREWRIKNAILDRWIEQEAMRSVGQS